MASADRGPGGRAGSGPAAIDAAWLEAFGLIGALYESEAAMEILDHGLDGVVDGVQATLHVDLRGNRSSPIYLQYFGSARPSELKRPVLRGPVDAMRGWPTSLAASDNTTLREHGVTLTDLLPTSRPTSAPRPTPRRLPSLAARPSDHRRPEQRLRPHGRLADEGKRTIGWHERQGGGARRGGPPPRPQAGGRGQVASCCSLPGHS